MCILYFFKGDEHDRRQGCVLYFFMGAIIQESDGIMDARGGQGTELHQKGVPGRKLMIARCILLDKPVVAATEVLESMTGLPSPARAEASGLANAVLDGTDCVRLSGRPQGGKFPINARSIMRRSCQSHRSSDLALARNLDLKEQCG